MAMNMARPHTDDLEAMPSRSPRSLFPSESQALEGVEDRLQAPGTVVLAPRDMSGRSSGSQNPGQFDERKERAFAGIGWGGSVKPESDTDRPNRASTTPFEFDNDEDYVAFADAREKEESLSFRNARSRDAARARSLTRGAARDIRGDRDTRSERERIRESRDTLRTDRSSRD